MATKSYQLSKITPKGVEFIKNRCNVFSTKGNVRGSVLKGSYNYNQKNGKVLKGEVLTPNIIGDNGKVITDVNIYATQLITWFEKYGKEFNMNPNILAAQSYQESEYRPYAYPKSSTAMGMTQFLVGTIFDVIIKNYYGGFTQTEIDIITNGIIGDKLAKKTYVVISGNFDKYVDSNRTEATNAINNSRILFQNIMDNPKLTIKAQAIYLSTIAQHHNNLAASALTLYFAGPSIRIDGVSLIKSKTYGNLLDIMKIKNNGKTYKVTFNGGVKYAKEILDILGDNKFKTIGFGFNIDLSEIVGNDIFDINVGQPLRVQKT